MSRTYRFTPKQIGELTVGQLNIYMRGIQVEKNDPAVRYEKGITDADVNKVVERMGLKVPRK